MKHNFKINHPVEHKIRQMAENLRNRLGNQINKPSNKSYRVKGIKSKIGESSREIYKYIYENFYEDVKEILENGQVPSIDRIDSNKDYEHGNIRIITYAENSRLGREKSKEVCSKPTRVTYENGESYLYSSAIEASRQTGISRYVIQKILAGKTKQRKEFRIEYEI